MAKSFTPRKMYRLTRRNASLWWCEVKEDFAGGLHMPGLMAVTTYLFGTTYVLMGFMVGDVLGVMPSVGMVAIYWAVPWAILVLLTLGGNGHWAVRLVACASAAYLFVSPTVWDVRQGLLYEQLKGGSNSLALCLAIIFLSPFILVVVGYYLQRHHYDYGVKAFIRHIKDELDSA